MIKLTPGRLLDLAVGVFGVDISVGIQLWEAGAFLAAARPAGLPAACEALTVSSYAETQGLGAYVPPVAPFPLVPTAPALLWWDAEKHDLAEPLVRLLAQRYPAQHLVELACFGSDGVLLGSGADKAGPGADRAGSAVQALTLAALPGLTLHSLFSILYLPPLPIAADSRGAAGLAWVMARLLGPGGCPWDVRQTHQSLRGALLEETYEAIEALDLGDMAALSEELGDLLIAIFGHSEMARQAGHFDLGDVFAQITAKLIRRHPHVFGDLTVDGEGQVLRNWEQIKAAELAAKGRSRASALDGVPPGMPALVTAQELGKKAARAGFNWAEQSQVWAKLREELEELADAASLGDTDHTAEELGDALFVLTRLADWLHVDAEMALRDANLKFRRRFGHIEAAAAAKGRALHELMLPELLALWDEAKG